MNVSFGIPKCIHFFSKIEIANPQSADIADLESNFSAAMFGCQDLRRLPELLSLVGVFGILNNDQSRIFNLTLSYVLG